MRPSDTRILAGVFVVLVAAFVLTKVFRSPARMSNVDTGALKVDTSAVTEIRLKVNDGVDDREIAIIKTSGSWNVEQSGVRVSADSYAVSTLLQALNDMAYDRVVTRNRDRWEDYGVSDQTGLNVTVSGSAGELSAFVVGDPREGEAFLRNRDADEVYAVDASLHGAFDSDFNTLRNKTFLKVSKELVSRLEFRYPADSGFVLERREGDWMIENRPADSARVERYLSTLRSRTLSAFADGFVPAGEPDITLVVGGTNADLEMVRAWRQPNSTWRLASGVQPGVYFSDSGTSIIADLFKRREDFLADSVETD